MSLPDETIGNWTPAQLQAFIQSLVATDPATIPSGLNLTNSVIDDLTVQKAFNLDSVQIQSAGTPFLPMQVPMAKDGGISVASFETGIRGDYLGQKNPVYQGAGAGDYVAWAFDPIFLVNSTDWGVPISNSGHLHLRTLWVPYDVTIYDIWFHVWTPTASSGGPYNGMGLYQYDQNSDVATLVAQSANDASPFHATHSNGANYTIGPVSIQAGLYYGACLPTWTTLTTAGIFGGTSSGAGTRVSNSKIPRAVNIGGQTGFPSTITGATLRANEDRNAMWMALS